MKQIFYAANMNCALYSNFFCPNGCTTNKCCLCTVFNKKRVYINKNLLIACLVPHALGSVHKDNNK